MKRYFIFAFLMLMPFLAKAQSLQDWGDQGNGTYINPILPADYSDPDAIRVGDKFYMVASDFHYLGMQVLESEDLVNWTLIGQIYDRFDYPGWDENKRYAGGSWAPALRYHDGKFWVYFCTPDEGLFMSTAENPAGPWAPLHLVKAIAKWEDPCPFWDEDGQAYLGRSQHGAGPIIIHRMSPDGKELLDEGKTVYTGPIAEGTKFLKKDGYYYLSIPEGGVSTGWQTILRSKNIYGPYEKKVVMEKGSTNINGPHQGAIVDTPDGEWWFLHFQQLDPLGRVVHLQPMHWSEDGWPVIGVDIDMNGIGEPVRTWTKPMGPKVTNTLIVHPASSDDFSGQKLGLQWQWNHNPTDNAYSLTEKSGYLVLHGQKAETFIQARNTLTQKTMGFNESAIAKMDVIRLEDGQCCGLACMGKVNHLLGLRKVDGKIELYEEANGQVVSSKPFNGKSIYFRLNIDVYKNQYRFAYSTDNKKFVDMGEAFPMQFGFWKGVRVGLYNYNTKADGGSAYFDWFFYN